MSVPVPPPSPPATNGPPIAAVGGPAATPAPARLAQRDGGNTSLGTFGVRLNSS